MVGEPSTTFSLANGRGRWMGSEDLSAIILATRRADTRDSRVQKKGQRGGSPLEKKTNAWCSRQQPVRGGKSQLRENIWRTARSDRRPPRLFFTWQRHNVDPGSRQKTKITVRTQFEPVRPPFPTHFQEFKSPATPPKWKRRGGGRKRYPPTS